MILIMVPYYVIFPFIPGFPYSNDYPFLYLLQNAEAIRSCSSRDICARIAQVRH